MGPLLASITQPLEADPTPIGNIDVAWSAIAPLLVLIVAALVLLVVDALSRRRVAPGRYAAFTSVAAVIAIVRAYIVWTRVQDGDRGPFSTLGHAVGVDGFSVFATIVICAAVVLGALLMDGWLRREEMEGAEPYVLLLLSASGGVMMASANDLIVMFLGLEILSLAVYVLAAMHLRKITSQEAGVKYFVLGAFSSAFFLYGIALTYGATGSTNLVDISSYLATTSLTDSGLLLAGMALLLVGFGFKVAAVPFHFWTPDVYQGAPSPSVAWMASGVKVAGFAGLIRVFFLGLNQYQLDWQPIVFAMAAVTLVVGSVLAVVQTDVKRMLAYSSISHAGFLLVGVQAATADGVKAALFYLAAYTFMVAGSFGVVTLVSRKGDIGVALDDFRGLSRDRPLLALTFSLFLFAQAGVPLTSGFFAKFYVINAAVDAGSTWLAIIAMVSAVIAAFLYLRIIVAMYMTTDDELPERRSIPIPFGAGLALGLAVVVTLAAGIFPSLLADPAGDATPVLVLEPAKGARATDTAARSVADPAMSPSATHTDAELVELARQGDRHAFHELLLRHDDRMRGLAFRLAADRHGMDDALTDAYTKAYRGLPGFRPGSDFGRWLYRITYNACIDELRRRKHEPPVPHPEDPAAPVASTTENVRRALAELSPGQRVTLVLVDGEGFDHHTAAEILGVAPGAVASRLYRARTKLRRRLWDVAR